VTMPTDLSIASRKVRTGVPSSSSGVSSAALSKTSERPSSARWSIGSSPGLP
jgi:hypothetical protein